LRRASTAEQNLIEDLSTPQARSRLFFREDLSSATAVQIFHHQICNPPELGFAKPKSGYVDGRWMTKDER